MSTKPIILRQHIRGSDDRPPENTLSLSLGEQELSYTIVLNGDQLRVVDGEDCQSEGSAVIHTQNGSVCVESLGPNVSVQSIASGFDGTSESGIMLLQVSNLSRRIYYQLHPGESLFVGSATISLVPEEHRDIPVSPYDSYRERVSQQVSQHQSPSPRAFATPVHHRARLMFSSPRQIETMAKQTETRESPGWISEPAEPISLEINRDILTIPVPESLEHHSEDPFVFALDTTATNHVDTTVVSFDPPEDAENGNLVDHAHADGQVFNEPNGEGDEKEPIPHKIVMENEMPNERENHQAFNSEETTEDEIAAERSDFIGSTAMSTPSLSQRKRRKLNSSVQSSPGVETEDSMRSNIVVQMPTFQRKESGQEKTPDRGGSLQKVVRFSGTETGRDQDSSDKPALETGASEISVREPRSVSKKISGPLPKAEKTIKILFASSTTIKNSRPMMRFLEKQGVEEAFTVTSCTALCVSNKLELRKTGKMIMAVLQGKSIITDDWVIRSTSAGRLLDMEDFKVSDEAREAEWGIVLGEVIKQNKDVTPKPFEGWNIAFTSAAKKDAGTSGFNELKEIALYAGAESCSTTLPKKSQEESQPTLIIACPNDPAMDSLRGRWRCFSRELIGLSSLRGKLDVDNEEFLVKSDPKTPRGGIKRKKQNV